MHTPLASQSPKKLLPSAPRQLDACHHRMQEQLVDRPGRQCLLPSCAVHTEVCPGSWNRKARYPDKDTRTALPSP